MNWHSARLTPRTCIDEDFRVTANVRRFLAAQLGTAPTLGRDFHAWAKHATGRTLAEVVRRCRRPADPTADLEGGGRAANVSRR